MIPNKETKHIPREISNFVDRFLIIREHFERSSLHLPEKLPACLTDVEFFLHHKIFVTLFFTIKAKDKANRFFWLLMNQKENKISDMFIRKDVKRIAHVITA